MSVRKSALAMVIILTSAVAGAQSLGDKSSNMGGAGLALPGSNGLNPGQLGLASGGYRLPIPTIEYRAHGRDIGEISSYLDRMRRLGLRPTMFSGRAGKSVSTFGGSIGLNYGDTSLSYYARGFEELLATSASHDLYGLAVEGYQFSHGRQFRSGAGRLSVGGSARLVTAYYDHQHTTSSGMTKMVGSGSSQQSGFGLDLGLLYQPDLRREMFYGLTVTNAISPNIAFDRVMPDGTVKPNGMEPFRTTVSAGVAGRVDDRTWFALDGLDLTNAIGRKQVALGLEHELSRYLTVQVGYNTRSAFTVGVSIFGITARLAGREPLRLESGIRF